MENNNLHEDNNNNNITCNNNLSKEEENDNTNIDINDVFDNIVKHHIEYKKPIVIKQEPVIEVITKVINEIKPKNNKKSKKIIKQSKINLDDKNDYDEEYDDTYDNYYD
jgi:hypothetical protein